MILDREVMAAKFCSRGADGVKATVMMIMVQFSTAGVNVFYKLASNDGMSVRIMIAYRFMLASAAVLPLALYFDRNKRPSLTWIVIVQAFICALFGGTIAQNLYAQSLVMTSATFAATATNLIPALTFAMAVLFRLEKLNLKTKAGKAKVIGTLICICGAMILTYYRGIQIKSWSIFHTGLLSHKPSGEVGHVAPTPQPKPFHHILGSFYAIASAVSSALGLIFRAKMSKRYPCHHSSTALICLMGVVQALVFALCMENKDWGEWRMGWNIRLLAVAYSGIVATGLMVIVVMWCLRVRGPLFVAVFSPLTLVLVALVGTLFLDENLYLGSVVGALVIVCGLYSVLWGNAEEMKEIGPLNNKQPSSPQNSDDDDRHRQSGDHEMSKISDEDHKNCNQLQMITTVEIAPNLPTTTIPPANNDSDDRDQEEGLPISQGKA